MTLGPKPNVLIVYLRSYKGMSMSGIRVIQPPPYYGGHPEYRALLDGSWEQKISQVAIHRVVEGFQPLFFLPPNGTVQVQFDNREGRKFKIVSVFSC